ncbi:metalloregulator ArsR/SmtB family transcription factor [Clostridium sp. AWRP]|uniref:ArsR/SmtB family transcription factor n=1 Tax=Clostridium sp. AWRP TaxID=2212991 RepID=UPI000FD8E73A|nr:metalloregulator ArsR/SmtB family transcription factor [Clostridium sp. AWRP]AZV57123.1 metalloregulator ArsR/SmtB family transcription factor [Clostridium sp. AWRP]
MDNNYKEYANTAELLKVLAHPIRLCIVRGLLDKGCCNVTHMQNCLQIPQSTLSQHLQKLRTAGIIEGTRNGLEVNYNVCNKTAIDLIHVLFK